MTPDEYRRACAAAYIRAVWDSRYEPVVRLTIRQTIRLARGRDGKWLQQPLPSVPRSNNDLAVRDA